MSGNKLKSAITLILLLAFILGELPADAAQAAGGDTYYVRMDGSDGSCDGLTDAGFPAAGNHCAFQAIQHAVDVASSGDTIQIAAGTYAEQVVINGENLTLQGAGEPTILEPFSLAASVNTSGGGTYGILLVEGGATATLRNLKVDASNLGAGPGLRFAGVVFYAAGGVVDGVTSVGSSNFSQGPETAGFFVGASGSPISVEIEYSSLAGIGGPAILVGEDTATVGDKRDNDEITVDIHDNVIKPDACRSAIQINPYASVTEVSSNLIDHPACATGVSPVSISLNTVVSGALVEDNTLRDSCQGIVATDSTNITISGNDLSGAGEVNASNACSNTTGIALKATTASLSNVTLSNNVIRSGFTAAGVELSAASPYMISASLTGNDLSYGDDSVDVNGILDDGDGTVAATLSGNKIYGWQNGIHFLNSSAVSGYTITDNSFTGNTYAINNGSSSGVSVNAQGNWWGSASGPLYPGNPDGHGDAVSANVNYSNYLTTWREVVVPASASSTDLADIFANAASGTRIVFAHDYSQSGAIAIDQPGLTIELQDGVALQNSSPCFTISAAATNTTITAQMPGGAKCIPTNGADGIDVADGVQNLIVDGLEINGSGQWNGDGIHFAGTAANIQIQKNVIHDLGGDGIYFAGSVTDMQIVDNQLYSNASDGLEFDAAPSGVQDIKGNLFQGNSFYGVNANYGDHANTLDVTYNSWGNWAGVASLSGFANNSSLYTPYTYADVVMSGSKTDLQTDKIVAGRAGDTITYTVSMNAENVTGVELTLLYPADNMSVVSTDTVNTAFGNNMTLDASVAGEVSFYGLANSGLDESNNEIYAKPVSGQSVFVFSVTFAGDTRLIPALATPNLNWEAAGVGFAMDPGSGPSNNVYASYLTEGSLTVLADVTVTSTVSLQGQVNRGGVAVALSTGLENGYAGPSATSSNTLVGNVSLADVVEDRYTITVTKARYLAASVTMTDPFSGELNGKTSFAFLELKGGDVTGADNTINVDDGALIGNEYGWTTTGHEVLDGDVNYDGQVDIYDLALMGGNYGETSAGAYASWTP